MKKPLRLIVATCVAAGFTAWAAPTVVQAQGNQQADGALDPDQNGLYDNEERKALLDVLQQAFPDALEGTFDADGNGEVTVEEQTAGRHPISMVIPWRTAESTPTVPWGIDIFPEWISSGYVQEDVAEGKVAEHAARGSRQRNGTQELSEMQPRKTGAHSGVEFAENSGQHLQVPGEREARWSYRWVLFTFRIDENTGNSNETVLLDLNSGNGSNRSSPKIWYEKGRGLHIQYVGLNEGGLDKRVMVAPNVVADGETWNVVVCGIRFGQMYASVNGVELSTRSKQPPRFSGELPPGKGIVTYLGDKRKGNMAWAYDALIMGLTEPSEAMVRKMTGWAAHRLDFASSLPDGHPYKTQRPVLDAEDFPDRYVHDEEKWLAWGASLKKSVTRANAGEPRVEPRGWERVFYDDFRAYRIEDSASGEADLWAGPGFNTAVGVDAPLVAPGKSPNAYPYDAENNHQILSLVQQGDRWRGSAFYSVNEMGHGYTWTGPKIFRIRCMFPKVAQKDLAGGLFPAFWSYGTDFLFWRTANRIENDWFEFDGQNGYWYNGIATHYHYSHWRNNIFAKNPNSYKRFKVYSGELTEAKSGIPGGLFIWDGQFHTWEWVVDERWTAVNVTITDENGNERWVEICRAPTSPTYLQRLDLQLDYALKANHGTPKERQDFVVDFVEVLQRTEDIEKIPAPFTARPTLSGTVAAGNTITVEPNLDGVTDVRYFWFADGYPLTWGPDNTYTLSEDEAGKEIRVMVKAVGALDQPEAWTDALK